MMSLLASLEEKLFGRKQVARCARWFSCGRESRARTYRGMRRMKKMSVVALTLLLLCSRITQTPREVATVSWSGGTCELGSWA
jgi:hypothetical protein